MKFLNKHFWKIVGVVVIILAIASFLSMKGSNKATEKEAETTEDLPQVEVLSFGNWTPDGNRSILLTIESDAEVDIVSELSGTVAQVYVNAGDTVRKGQTLLKFSTSLDQAAINYQNALQALESTRINNTASIESSRIALDNAQNDLDQTRRQEEINFQKVITDLRTQARNSETNFSQALDLMDQSIGVSSQYKYAIDGRRGSIGGRDSIGKNKNRNQIETLLRAFDQLSPLPSTDDLAEVSRYAEARVNYARSLQEAFTLFESLVRGAVFTAQFRENDLQNLTNQVDNIRNGLNSSILTLSNALEEARTAEERKNLAILSAENRYKSAQTSYEVAQSSANSQETNAQNQLRIAQVSQNDLIIRAPFDGIISEKDINTGAQASPGQKLFRITNPKSSKKGVAFLSLKEYDRLKTQETLEIIINDQALTVEKRGVSARLDSQSQKMRVEFTLPPEAAESILVGQIGKVLLPANGDQTDLLPLSSISFEPDGAEVLVVNNDSKTERKKITVGKLRSNAIEVTSGLMSEDKVLRYRNRSYAGQEVEIKP